MGGLRELAHEQNGCRFLQAYRHLSRHLSPISSHLSASFAQLRFATHAARRHTKDGPPFSFFQDQLDLRHKPHVDLIFEATKEDVVSLGMDPLMSERPVLY